MTLHGNPRTAAQVLVLWWDESTQAEHLSVHPIPATRWDEIIAWAKARTPSRVPLAITARPQP